MKFLLLHGLAGDPTNWVETSYILKECGHKCFIPEIHYFNSNFSSIPDLAANILNNIPNNFLNEDTIVVGNSLGGSIALSLGENYSKIILVASYAKTSIPGMGLKLTTFAQELSRIFHYPNKLTKNQRNTYEKLWENITSRDNIPRLNRIKRAALSFDDEQYYQKLHHKLQFICGGNDQVSPLEYFNDLKLRYPSIELFTIPDCGHAIPVEKPQELANYIIMSTEKKYA
ncbi:MAG: alpha/beta fold hydrolase [Nitrospirae bacterium]|nr:alpha/beta fold hydrolase [Nitrospirota bacterium]